MENIDQQNNDLPLLTALGSVLVAVAVVLGQQSDLALYGLLSASALFYVASIVAYWQRGA